MTIRCCGSSYFS